MNVDVWSERVPRYIMLFTTYVNHPQTIKRLFNIDNAYDLTEVITKLCDRINIPQNNHKHIILENVLELFMMYGDDLMKTTVKQFIGKRKFRVFVGKYMIKFFSHYIDKIDKYVLPPINAPISEYGTYDRYNIELDLTIGLHARTIGFLKAILRPVMAPLVIAKKLIANAYTHWFVYNMNVYWFMPPNRAVIINKIMEECGSLKLRDMYATITRVSQRFFLCTPIPAELLAAWIELLHALAKHHPRCFFQCLMMRNNGYNRHTNYAIETIEFLRVAEYKNYVFHPNGIYDMRSDHYNDVTIVFSEDTSDDEPSAKRRRLKK